MRTDSFPNTLTPALPSVLIAGFGGAVAALVAWFVMHLPAVAAPESAARAVILMVWFGSLVALIWRSAGSRAIGVGLGSGLLSAVVGAVMIAGTRTRADGASAPTVALGFVGIGLVLGLAAGVVVRVIGPARPSMSNHPVPWLARFALVTAAAVAPLLFIGGLVTSTDSGMAVPDWPSTFGAHMLNYPLDSKTPLDIFLEHSHRLFGMLVGLASLTLLVAVLITGRVGWARTATVIAFVLVCAQGVLGGIRVRNDSRPLAMLHGVLAQLVFGLIVALAAYLSPGYARPPAPGQVDPKVARRLKAFATGLMHVLILQLLLGAVSRHFRKSDHAMWTHAALSVVVVIMATMAGFAAAALPRTAGTGVLALRRCGGWLVAVVVVQFLLGWATFFVRGRTIQAETMLEALVRTAHQANGALLIGIAACAFVWARWLWRAVRAEGRAVNAAAAVPVAGQVRPA